MKNNIGPAYPDHRTMKLSHEYTTSIGEHTAVIGYSDLIEEPDRTKDYYGRPIDVAKTLPDVEPPVTIAAQIHYDTGMARMNATSNPEVPQIGGIFGGDFFETWIAAEDGLPERVEVGFNLGRSLGRVAKRWKDYAPEEVANRSLRIRNVLAAISASVWESFIPESATEEERSLAESGQLGMSNENYFAARAAGLSREEILDWNDTIKSFLHEVPSVDIGSALKGGATKEDLRIEVGYKKYREAAWSDTELQQAIFEEYGLEGARPGFRQVGAMLRAYTYGAVTEELQDAVALMHVRESGQATNVGLSAYADLRGAGVEHEEAMYVLQVEGEYNRGKDYDTRYEATEMTRAYLYLTRRGVAPQHALDVYPLGATGDIAGSSYYLAATRAGVEHDQIMRIVEDYPDLDEKKKRYGTALVNYCKLAMLGEDENHVRLSHEQVIDWIVSGGSVDGYANIVKRTETEVSHARLLSLREEGKDIENIGRLLSVDDGIDFELALRLDQTGVKSKDMRRVYEEVDYDLEKALKLVTA